MIGTVNDRGGKREAGSLPVRSKLPAAHYAWLKHYWSQPGISYDYSAYMDSHFDLHCWWVGERAIDTFLPFWAEVGTVSVESQRTHMCWVEMPKLKRESGPAAMGEDVG